MGCVDAIVWCAVRYLYDVPSPSTLNEEKSEVVERRGEYSVGFCLSQSQAKREREKKGGKHTKLHEVLHFQNCERGMLN